MHAVIWGLNQPASRPDPPEVVYPEIVVNTERHGHIRGLMLEKVPRRTGKLRRGPRSILEDGGELVPQAHCTTQVAERLDRIG